MTEITDHARALLCEAALCVHSLGVAEKEFDIPKLGEVCAHDVEEATLVFGQALCSQKLDQIAEIVPAMERQPVHFIRKDKAGRGEELPKRVEVDSHLAVLIELNPALLQKLDGRLGEHVLVEVEFEVEHPGARKVHEVVRVG